MSKPLQRLGSGIGFSRAAGALVFASVLAYAGLAIGADSGTVKTVVSEQSGAESAAKQAQEKVNQIDDQTRTVVNDYRATIQEAASLKRYNEQLALQLKSQEVEMVSIAKELEQIETTSREIVPLLQKMLETLAKFVALDLPFLPEERSNRVKQLTEMMGRADVSISEKYRRIVEGYQVEMEYGRTLEAYSGKVGDKTVEFLRAGRIALLYETLDGKEAGYWDATKKAFVKDNGYKDSVKSGLKVAKKQVAPDLLIVPISAPQEIK